MDTLANYDIFEQLLKEKEVYMEKIENEEEVYFRVDQRLDSGANITLVISFYKNKNFVDIEIYNLVSLSSPLKEESFLSLINELNGTARFAKYYLIKQDVKVFYPLTYNCNFDKNMAQEVFDVGIMLMRSCDDSYPKFMKLQWS